MYNNNFLLIMRNVQYFGQKLHKAGWREGGSEKEREGGAAGREGKREGGARKTSGESVEKALALALVAGTALQMRMLGHFSASRLF